MLTAQPLWLGPSFLGQNCLVLIAQQNLCLSLNVSLSGPGAEFSILAVGGRPWERCLGGCRCSRQRPHLLLLLCPQHFLTALGGLVAVPLILAKDLCLQHDPLTQSYLISTMFFVAGICTLLQVFLGVR